MKNDLGSSLLIKHQDQLIGRTNFEAMDSPMDSKVQNDKQVEDFNKLNSDFSERIKDINGNAQETKVKVRKEVESDNKELNENNKRITVYQGSSEKILQ
ncbi:hypothetical protein GLOIN_2v1792107 [Rhizophagus irregularis DAOM 181602=DAOM 197198]|uniref:Uncharacterized protein n=2 Tax=Rhizophagus irregularis TaxID=588596 RepID=A0A2P4NLH4_RHIID|nr:hypothetical protein GLOIN_2v1792107 [Rhizophagus irregularis DAOM 181602=DAOM 197198]POG53980.1 hypothetical protein GLOIN_2v1792107 [Rhizophagus irregularis DAOM 181602=DAOM 197198]GBC30748.2 hypothetical protein GLOIN_2v1792107 [Rhizophagus irregularis DAOM 181602=DAOM 197198]CAG8753253.1 8492_t:CDS:2 [Rhizophagus irregularis]|eukprot:XP_025164217.1 hypothetical protein GLOIN_2v1792107 [Rhizophagus irregularis DAOM 181602=DAOM 197198]